MSLTLDQIRPGQKAVILSLHSTGAVRTRLMDMGLIRGAEVSVERVAPLGDPMEIKVKGYCLSLRKSEASQVEVDAR